MLAYIGVMGVQDGVEYTLYALDELIHKRGRQDVSLVLIGDGDHAPALHALAHQLQFEPYINFADKIEILLDNEDFRYTMGAIGRAHIVDELQWEHHKEYLLQAYEALFQGQSPSPGRNFLTRGTRNAEISAAICQEVEDGDCAALHLLQLAHEKTLSCWEE